MFWICLWIFSHVFFFDILICCNRAHACRGSTGQPLKAQRVRFSSLWWSESVLRTRSTLQTCFLTSRSTSRLSAAMSGVKKNLSRIGSMGDARSCVCLCVTRNSWGYWILQLINVAPGNKWQHSYVIVVTITMETFVVHTSLSHAEQ